MASNKGSTAELDSVICVRMDRPERMDAMKPRGMFCKVLAVVEVCKYELDFVRVGVGVCVCACVFVCVCVCVCWVCMHVCVCE
jgi:hypothetical protein